MGNSHMIIKSIKHVNTRHVLVMLPAHTSRGDTILKKESCCIPTLKCSGFPQGSGIFVPVPGLAWPGIRCHIGLIITVDLSSIQEDTDTDVNRGFVRYEEVVGKNNLFPQ